MPLRVSFADIKDLIKAVGIESTDDTELRFVFAELGLDFDTLAMAYGVPKASDLVGGGMRSSLALLQSPSLRTIPSGVITGKNNIIDLTVNPKALSDLYTQPPCIEGGELQPLFEDLIKRDRALVGAGNFFVC